MLWAFAAFCLVPGALAVTLGWRPAWIAYLALGWGALMARTGWKDTRRWLASDTRELRGELLAVARVMSREALFWQDYEDDVVLGPVKLGPGRPWGVVRQDLADLDSSEVFTLPAGYPGVQLRALHSDELKLRRPAWKRVWGEYRAEEQGLYGVSPGEVSYLLTQLRRAVPLERPPWAEPGE
jgi:hypothetical protein